MPCALYSKKGRLLSSFAIIGHVFAIWKRKYKGFYFWMLPVYTQYKFWFEWICKVHEHILLIWKKNNIQMSINRFCLIYIKYVLKFCCLSNKWQMWIDVFVLFEFHVLWPTDVHGIPIPYLHSQERASTFLFL